MKKLLLSSAIALAFFCALQPLAAQAKPAATCPNVIARGRHLTLNQINRLLSLRPKQMSMEELETMAEPGCLFRATRSSSSSPGEIVWGYTADRAVVMADPTWGRQYLKVTLTNGYVTSVQVVPLDPLIDSLKELKTAKSAPSLSQFTIAQAPYFSTNAELEQKFKQIKIGWTFQQVETLLGKPQWGSRTMNIFNYFVDQRTMIKVINFRHGRVSSFGGGAG